MSQRQQRATALIAAAAIVIVLAAAVYLRSSSAPKLVATPTPDRSMVSGVPVIYDFVTPSVGWAVESPIEPTAAVAIFKTTDGSKHWQQELLQPTYTPEPIQVQIQFIDRLHGFVAAGGPLFGVLYRTSDGGRNWASSPLPANARSFDAVAFSDPMNGWLLGRSFGPHLYSTEDAGTNWSPRPTLMDAFGLSVRNSNEAWSGSFAPGVPHVYMSTDAGATWQRRDLPPPPGISWDAGDSNGQPFIKTTVQLLPGVGEVALVDTGITGGTYTFRSFDLGVTWTSAPNPPGQVVYQDSLHWWAMHGTSLFKSADAGQTWTEATNALPDWQYAPNIVDSNHAWAQIVVVGGYGLAATGDGGLHWTRSRVPQVLPTVQLLDATRH